MYTFMQRALGVFRWALLVPAVGVFAWAAVAPAVEQQPVAAAARLPAIAEDLARLPADADRVLVIDDASALRSTGVSESALRGLDAAGTRGEIDAAWKLLSEQLGWSSTEAFDRLVGRRVVLLTRRGAGTPSSQAEWALLSVVSAETELRLKQRLRVAARELLQGTQVLSVENGKYELVALRNALGAAGDVTLVLGPVVTGAPKGAGGVNVADAGGGVGRGEARPLFDKVVWCLANAAARPLATKNDRPRDGKSRDAKSKPQKPPGLPEGTVSTFAPNDRERRVSDRSATADEQGVSGGSALLSTARAMDVLVQRSAGGALPEVLLLQRGTPGSFGRTAPPGEIAHAVAGDGGGTWDDFLLLTGRRIEQAQGGAEQGGRGWTVSMVLRDRTQREALAAVPPSLDGCWHEWRQGTVLSLMRMAELPPGTAELVPFLWLAPNLPVPERAEGLMTARQAMRAHTMIARGGGEGGGHSADEARPELMLTIARETTDRRALATIADGAVGRFLDQLERRSGRASGPSESFAGLAPGAARVATVELGSGGVGTVGTGRGDVAMGVPFGGPLAVGWNYPVSARGVGSGVEARKGEIRDRSRQSGWWVISVVPSRGESGADVHAGPKVTEVLADAGLVLGSKDGCRQGDVAGGEIAGGEARRWLWLLSARPAELERALPPLLPDIGGWRGWLTLFDTVELKFNATDDGDLEGSASLMLRG